MSFNDLERQAGPRTAIPAGDTGLAKLQDAVSLQVFKINGNVRGIEKIVDRLAASSSSGGGGGAADREALSELLDTTRHLVQTSTSSLKTLLAHPSASSGSPQTKAVHQKLSREFQAALANFQRVQRSAAEVQRTAVSMDKGRLAVAEEEQHAQEEQAGRQQQQQQQQQQHQHQLLTSTIPAHELEFQEAQIAERESEIREIETGIVELNEIFRDLSTLVATQGGMLDNIESNITSVGTHTAEASRELTTAHEYQRKAGRRKLWLLVVLLVVIGIVLLAILS